MIDQIKNNYWPDPMERGLAMIEKSGPLWEMQQQAKNQRVCASQARKSAEESSRRAEEHEKSAVEYEKAVALLEGKM